MEKRKIERIEETTRSNKAAPRIEIMSIKEGIMPDGLEIVTENAFRETQNRLFFKLCHLNFPVNYLVLSLWIKIVLH